MRIIDKLKQHLRDAADYNPEVQVAPACILWPDKESQWESVIPRIHTEMTELFILGEYDPERSTGPRLSICPGWAARIFALWNPALII